MSFSQLLLVQRLCYPSVFWYGHWVLTNAKALKMNSVDPLIKDGEAAGMLGCSKSTFWRRVADGTIPRPVKIGGMSRWPQSEIATVIDDAKALREL